MLKPPIFLRRLKKRMLFYGKQGLFENQNVQKRIITRKRKF